MVGVPTKKAWKPATETTTNWLDEEPFDPAYYDYEDTPGRLTFFRLNSDPVPEPEPQAAPATETRGLREEVDLSRYAVPPGTAPGGARKPTGKKSATAPTSAAGAKPGSSRPSKASNNANGRKPKANREDVQEPDKAVPLTPDDILFGATSTKDGVSPEPDVITIDGEIPRELAAGSALDSVVMSVPSRDSGIDQAKKSLASKESSRKPTNKAGSKKSSKTTAKSANKTDPNQVGSPTSAKSTKPKAVKSARARSTTDGSPGSTGTGEDPSTSDSDGAVRKGAKRN